jgi:hypothetical protein
MDSVGSANDKMAGSVNMVLTFQYVTKSIICLTSQKRYSSET